MHKIIHLSDLHIGHKNLGDVFSAMLDRLIYLFSAEEHVIVITGDSIDKLSKGEHLAEFKEHLERLKDYQVLICPGNHDYGSGTYTDAEGMATFKEAVYGEPNEKFPRFHAIGDIAFIGLDSMEAEIEKEEGEAANGELGERQLNRLDELLSSEQVANCRYRVVYLHHHPLDMGGFIKRRIHGLDDAPDLKKTLKKHRIDALLFGHNHDGKHWNGNWGIKRCYDAGSSTGKGGKQGPHRVIDLSKEIYTDFDAKL